MPPQLDEPGSIILPILGAILVLGAAYIHPATAQATVHVDFGGNIDNPGLDWWMELVFWVCVFAFCFRYDAWLVMAFSLGGIIHLVNSTWGFGLANSIPLIGVGMLAEILTRSHKRRKTERETT